MVTVLRHKTWSGIAVSAVWQGELVLCAVWDRSNSITVTDCVIVSFVKKMKEPRSGHMQELKGWDTLPGEEQEMRVDVCTTNVR